MDRKRLTAYIAETYGADPEFMWQAHPNFAVFRHSSNRKWFAVIMDVPREKLGAAGGGTLDILNVKCDPRMLGAFRGQPGFYPAYHMSKAAWLSAALDGTVGGDQLKLLLDMSFDLTAPKTKKRKT